jgi:hypothetical protein
MYGASWEYFSPKKARVASAFETIKINLADCMSDIADVSVEDLDIICLPEGWDVPESNAHKTLCDMLSRSSDRNFLQRALESKQEVKA